MKIKIKLVSIVAAASSVTPAATSEAASASEPASGTSPEVVIAMKFIRRPGEPSGVSTRRSPRLEASTSDSVHLKATRVHSTELLDRRQDLVLDRTELQDGLRVLRCADDQALQSGS